MSANAPAAPSGRESWFALGYFAVYFVYLFVSLESDVMHWIGLVALPLVLVVALRPRDDRTARGILASFGLRRGNLTRGVGWAIALGVVFSVLQALFTSRGGEIQEMFRSGRALFMYPLAFGFMMLLPGFTEEFFFRGFLQTRLEVLLRSRWAAMLAVTFLFGVYHLPYAFHNPRWPSAGDWGDAWQAALGNGIPGGLVLGTLFVLTRKNLVACMVLHSMINAIWAMTMIRFSGG